MRHELCLDNRNEPKWRVTLKTAIRTGAKVVVYAAMFIRDTGKDGDKITLWPSYDPKDAVDVQVRRFLEREQARAMQKNALKPRGDLWRIALTSIHESSV